MGITVKQITLAFILIMPFMNQNVNGQTVVSSPFLVRLKSRHSFSFHVVVNCLPVRSGAKA